MKKTIILLIAGAALALGLAGCGGGPALGKAFGGEVNAYPGVTMKVVEGTAAPGGAEIEILSGVSAEIDSGNEYDFGLQAEKDGVWYALREKGELTNNSQALVYAAGIPVRQSLSWAERYGALPAGHYRVVKQFFEYHVSGGQEYFLLAAEFTIK